MIIQWERRPRPIVGGVWIGSPTSYFKPLYFFGLAAVEGVVADTVRIYAAPYADDARKLTDFGWGGVRRAALPFFYPLFFRDGLHVLNAPAIHVPTPLFLYA